MKKTTSKISIILLITALMIGLISNNVFATNPEINNTLDFTSEGFTQTSGDGWAWDASSKTLIINDLNLNVTSGNGIQLPDDSTIVVEGVSSIQTAKYYGIKCDGKLTVKGDNLLTINTDASSFKAIIYTKGDLDIENAQIKSTSNGIFSLGNININDSNIDITASSYGIGTDNAGTNISIENSKIKLVSTKSGGNYQSYGIYTAGATGSYGDIKVKNSNLDIKYNTAIMANSDNIANKSSVLIDGGTIKIQGEGLRSKYGNTKITNKANVNITTSGEEWAILAYNADVEIDNNSKVIVDGNGHGIITNGTSGDIKVTDSTVKVLLPNSPIGMRSMNDIYLKDSDTRIIANNISGLESTYAANKITVDGGLAAFKATGTAYQYDLYTSTRVAINAANVYLASSIGWFSNNNSNNLLFHVNTNIDNSTADILESPIAYVYGDVTLDKDFTVKANQILNVASGSTLTVNQGVTLTNNGIINNMKNTKTGAVGTIVNNGTINNNNTINNKGIIANNAKIINLNDSAVVAQDANAVYTGNDTITNMKNDLDFSLEEIQNKYNDPNGNIYWNNNKLTIKNLILEAKIILPDGADTTIETGKNVTATGAISIKNGKYGSVTFTGEPLKLNGYIEGENGSIIIDGTTVTADFIIARNDNSKLILHNGANLKLTNGASIGGPGMDSGEIVLEGASILESKGDNATLITGKFTIKDADSKIIVSVAKHNIAVASGNTDAYKNLKIPSGSHLNPNNQDVQSILDENNEPLNELTLILKTYTITASANDGGSISDEGITTLLPGENKTYKITLQEGYKLKDVLVDEKSQGNILEYEFKDVSEEHKIEAIFEKIVEDTTKTYDNDDKKNQEYDETSYSETVKTGDDIIPAFTLLAVIASLNFIINIKRKNK